MFTPKNRFLRLCEREQSRALDKGTIESFGIESTTLMEIAGLKASEFIRKQTGEGRYGLYICGKGNNAGDAFVVARHLLETAGHHISVLLVSGDENLSPDASKNYTLLKKLHEHNSDRIRIITDFKSEEVEQFDYIVDGMIGTGLSSELREPLSSVVEWINSGVSTIFALDIPTGLDCDSGHILGNCVQADFTITFGTNKQGFYLGEGPSVTGSVYLADLPFPEHLRHHRATLINEDLLQEFVLNRAPAEHKYQRGAVHIVAGSEGMTGAAIMAARSAWKTGAGAVFLYAPRGILPIYEQTLPQIIKKPVGKPGDTAFSPDATDEILENIETKNGPVLAGPGLGLSAETKKFLLNFLPEVDQTVLLDADGLSVWEDLPELDISKWIITPHPGELQNSLNITSESDKERLDKVKKLSGSKGCRILSKGSPVIFTSPAEGSFITGYDTKLFSRAGFGDVLAGTIAGNLSVSDNADRCILHALISNYLSIRDLNTPEPSNVYDR